MATEIERDQEIILRYLYVKDEETSGLAYVGGQEISSVTNLATNRINTAVRLLRLEGLIELKQAIGSFPFDFHVIKISPRGKLEIQRKESAQKTKESTNLVEMKSTPFWAFICYVRNSGSDFAAHLKKSLEHARTHMFLDTEDIPMAIKGTTRWFEFRDQCIRDSGVLLLICTVGIEESTEVSKELTLALHEDKEIMILRHQDMPTDMLVQLQNGSTRNLADFNQIQFETKEDLVRKVLGERARGTKKP